MELIITGNKTTDAIPLNHESENFKVTVVGVSSGFNGTWKVQYSPNGVDWIDHEDFATQATGTKTCNLFFNIPYVRFVQAGTGTMKMYLYGSVI